MRLGLLRVARETERQTDRRARKTNVKAPNVLMAFPFAGSFVRSFIRPFSHSRRVIKITWFAGRKRGAGAGVGRTESELYYA